MEVTGPTLRACEPCVSASLSFPCHAHIQGMHKATTACLGEKVPVRPANTHEPGVGHGWVLAQGEGYSLAGWQGDSGICMMAPAEGIVPWDFCDKRKGHLGAQI